MAFTFNSKTINAGNNAKTVKGDGSEFVTAIMYLAPHMASGFQVCPMAKEAGCEVPCLNLAGRGAMSNVQQARVAKTRRFFENRAEFMLQLEKDIAAFARKAGKIGAQACIRLNGTSDIRWESVAFFGANGEKYANIMARFPELVFYDYTKIMNRRNIPENYSLTLSYSEASEAYAERVVAASKESDQNVAVVFNGKVPRNFMGRPVVNGDKDDMRFLDPLGVIVALKAKGPAKKDESGFVVHWEENTRKRLAAAQSNIELGVKTRYQVQAVINAQKDLNNALTI